MDIILCLYWQDKVSKVTVFARRKVDNVAESYGVDLSEEEGKGRLVQHVEGMYMTTWKM